MSLFKKLVICSLLLIPTISHATTFRGAVLRGVTISSTSGSSPPPDTCTWVTAWTGEVAKCSGGSNNGDACITDNDCADPGACLLASGVANFTTSERDIRFALPADIADIPGTDASKIRVTFQNVGTDQGIIAAAGISVCPSSTTVTDYACTTTPTEITINDGASHTQDTVYTTAIVSDDMNFTWTKSVRHLMHVTWKDRSGVGMAWAGSLYGRWQTNPASYQALVANPQTPAMADISAGGSGPVGISKIELCVTGVDTGVPWVAGYSTRQLIKFDPNGTHSGYNDGTDYIALTAVDTTSGYQADCDDLKIYYYNGSTNTEVKRKVTACNSTNTNVYFKIPYDLAPNDDIATTTNKVYLYHGNGSATCTTGCSDYVNTNFPQAPLTPAASTLALWDFETTTNCKVCTGDVTYNDFGCTTNGDCGTGTCTATQDLCDISGIQKPHQLDACDQAGTTCSSTPVYAASARIGEKAIDCTGTGTTTYKAKNPTFDNEDLVVLDFWAQNKTSNGDNGSKRMWGSGGDFELRYTNMAEANKVCNVANNNGDCANNDDCCWSSEPFRCVNSVCEDYRSYLFDVMVSSSSNAWATLDPAPVDAWTHYRVEFDDESPTQDRWRMWVNGQAFNYEGNTSWVSPTDCTASLTPYACCTGSGTGCAAIVAPTDTGDFLICNGMTTNNPWTGYMDDFRISSADLGAPDWVVDPAEVVLGTAETP